MYIYTSNVNKQSQFYGNELPYKKNSDYDNVRAKVISHHEGDSAVPSITRSRKTIPRVAAPFKRNATTANQAAGKDMLQKQNEDAKALSDRSDNRSGLRSQSFKSARRINALNLTDIPASIHDRSIILSKQVNKIDNNILPDEINLSHISDDVEEMNMQQAIELLGYIIADVLGSNNKNEEKNINAARVIFSNSNIYRGANLEHITELMLLRSRLTNMNGNICDVLAISETNSFYDGAGQIITNLHPIVVMIDKCIEEINCLIRKANMKKHAIKAISVGGKSPRHNKKLKGPNGHDISYMSQDNEVHKKEVHSVLYPIPEAISSTSDVIEVKRINSIHDKKHKSNTEDTNYKANTENKTDKDSDNFQILAAGTGIIIMLFGIVCWMRSGKTKTNPKVKHYKLVPVVEA